MKVKETLQSKEKKQKETPLKRMYSTAYQLLKQE